MSPRNTDKNKDVIKDLEKTISPILVVNNSTLKPYVELFEYSPENIYQQPLGSLVGFFEVKEFSDESAYIVNFLTSVLKKEYYINPKRPVTESLDSALHKVNMALSELAKHGNVEWLGKINAAICVLEKNNTHFSVAGDAKIFLYRNQNLSEISEDLASDSPDPHPLKTFVNVSSGRLEKDDRVLITSADIFQILTVNEIKKNLQRYEGDKFVQFMRTALSNQIEMVVSIVVEMTEAIVIPTTKTKSNKKSLQTANAFSGQTFANVKASEMLTHEGFDLIDDADNDPEYTDEKTGHIYVQGDANENNETANAQINLYWDMVKEKISQGSYVTKNEIRKRFSLYKKQLARKKELRRIEKEKRDQLEAEENKRLEAERAILEIQQELQRTQEEELERIRIENEAEEERIKNIKAAEIEQARQEQEKIEQKKINAQQKESRISIPIKDATEQIQDQSAQSNFMRKLELARIEQQRLAALDLNLQNNSPENEAATVTVKITEPQKEYETENKTSSISGIEKTKTIVKEFAKQILLLSEKILVFAKAEIEKIPPRIKKSDILKSKNLTAITPHFSKIGKLFSRFSSKQKLYTIGALALIFIAPLFIVHFMDKPKQPIVNNTPPAPLSQSELLAYEKNINLRAQDQLVFSNQNIITTLIANNNPIIITKSSVITLQNNLSKEFPIPANSGTPIKATFMNDLSLILILTDSNKVISFSPISTKFTENKINLSNISPSSFVGTYLTYLYVVDQKNNQIYRFPRADGGFGESTNWLKDSTPLSNISGITIDDNIYAISNNQILKLFKGQKQPFTLENSKTPVQLDNIYTTPELQAIYALDKENSRLIKYAKDGSIVAQYFNEKIKNGTSIAIDETNKIAYITTPLGLLSISIQ